MLKLVLLCFVVGLVKTAPTRFLTGCLPDEPPALCDEGYDPCKNATCATHPRATCTVSTCGTCHAEFYDNAGKTLNCTGCMPGEPPALCDEGYDPCKNATCADHPNATCRVSTCGTCHAEFYDNADRKLHCAGCNSVEPYASCNDGYDPCKSAACAGHPYATCRVSTCGTCHAEFSYGNAGKKLHCVDPMP